MADHSKRRGGVGWAWVDGVYQDVTDATHRLSTVTRTTLVGLNGVHGYSETPQPGFIAFTVRDSNTLRVSDYSDMTNVAVVLQLANGKRISGTGLWTAETQEVNDTEGTFAVRFEGEDVREG